ncbi:MAG: hypothetical protein ACKVXR_00600, partial [Planctomycetota bacterium]
MRAGRRKGGRTRRPRWPIFVIGLVLGGAAVAWWRSSASSVAFSVPDPDTSEREALVVESLTKARNAVLAKPDSPEAWRHFAAVLDVYEHSAEAEIAYRRALELAPGDLWC